MSKPSVRAALKRLTEWSRWQTTSYDPDLHPYNQADNPYAREVGKHNHIEDTALLCDALTILDDTADHLECRDTNPVYEVKLDADWRAKSFLDALTQAVANGRRDSEDTP